MMAQFGFFDADKRLSAKGDPLVRVSAIVDTESSVNNS
jgi:hypothetical protein